MDDLLKNSQWAICREIIFKTYGTNCMRCAATKKEARSIQVDHIVPRHVRPDMTYRLVNLQVLCDECNRKKGVSENKDWDCREGEWRDRLIRATKDHGDMISDYVKNMNPDLFNTGKKVKVPRGRVRHVREIMRTFKLKGSIGHKEYETVLDSHRVFKNVMYKVQMNLRTGRWRVNDKGGRGIESLANHLHSIFQFR